jgi:hypothetical protein
MQSHVSDGFSGMLKTNGNWKTWKKKILLFRKIALQIIKIVYDSIFLIYSHLMAMLTLCWSLIVSQSAQEKQLSLRLEFVGFVCQPGSERTWRVKTMAAPGAPEVISGASNPDLFLRRPIASAAGRTRTVRFQSNLWSIFVKKWARARSINPTSWEVNLKINCVSAGSASPRRRSVS